MNNNMTTERAHLGVFGASSYISIKDPYEKKSDQDPRLKGKQFSADFPKEGIGGARPNNALFEREYKWLYSGGEKYVDRTMYIKTQPRDQRKKGFCSSDATRTDEFTLDIETQKWRERITTEMQFADRFAKYQEAEMTDEQREEMAKLSAPPARRWTHGPKFLFDLGKEATGGVTPYEMKDARDTWYSKHRVKELDDGQRHTGGIMLSSHAYGDNLKDYTDWAKPEFARQPVIRDNFFRSTGVLRKPTTF